MKWFNKVDNIRGSLVQPLDLWSYYCGIHSESPVSCIPGIFYYKTKV